MKLKLYAYEVIFNSGRKDKFTTKEEIKSTIGIVCVNRKDGSVWGKLTVNDSFIESIFVEEVESDEDVIELS